MFAFVIPFVIVIWGQQIDAITTWPKGTYALVEPAQGCPSDGSTHFHEGWVYHDTDDEIVQVHSGLFTVPQNGNSSWTKNLRQYMKGIFNPSHITVYFCVKDKENTNSGALDTWPNGTYCLYKKGNCSEGNICVPIYMGFSSGSVEYHDESLGNQNKYGGVMPDGSFVARSSHVTEEFCCRQDRNQTVPISLPTARPFILVRHQGLCQYVQSMYVYDLHIRFDTENDPKGHFFHGEHPVERLVGSDIIMHYCYYTRTKLFGVPYVVFG